MISDFHSPPASCSVNNASSPVRYFSGLGLLCWDPQNLNSSLHNKKRTWKMCWETESPDNKPPVCQEFALPGWQCGARTIKTDQQWVTKGELKDDQQLFAFLLRPEEEMGLHWSRRDLDWHMKGFLTQGNAFSRTAQSSLLLLLFKNTESGVFWWWVRDQRAPEFQRHPSPQDGSI